MEGISHEAARSPARSSSASSSCSTTTTASPSTARWSAGSRDDTPKRFEAYGWHVVPNVDGHDAEAVAAAIKKARAARTSRRSSAARPSSAGARPTSRARSPRTARRSGPKKSPNAPQDARLDVRAVRDPGRHPRRLGPPRSGRRRREEVDPDLSSATSANIPAAGARVRASHEGRSARELARDRAGGAGRGRRSHGRAGHARVLAGRVERARSEAAGAARRFRGPHRLGEHAPQGFGRSHQRRLPWQLRLLRRARIRHDGHHERPRPCTAASVRTAARSSCSPTTRAMPCASRRSCMRR